MYIVLIFLYHYRTCVKDVRKSIVLAIENVQYASNRVIIINS